MDSSNDYKVTVIETVQTEMTKLQNLQNGMSMFHLRSYQISLFSDREKRPEVKKI